MIKLLFAVLLSAIAVTVNAKEQSRMFTQSDFNQLKFLEGRWQGSDPKGNVFYEQYDFPDGVTLRSLRFPTREFATSTDTSTVTLKDGEIISRWGDFSWRASEITRDKACFEPVNAPSAFCWTLSSPTALEVSQRWKDASGKEQTMTMALKRLD